MYFIQEISSLIHIHNQSLFKFGTINLILK